jgi:copper chaperone CopZ
MTLQLKHALASAAILASGGVLSAAQAQQVTVARQAPDTATVRLRISKMTCGGCATTARLALKKLDGVLAASVSYGDSIGVVRYDPRRVTPEQITAHLTRLTGYPSRVLPDSGAAKP